MSTPPSQICSLLVCDQSQDARGDKAAEEQAAAAFPKPSTFDQRLYNHLYTFTKLNNPYPFATPAFPTVKSCMVPILTRRRSVSILRRHNSLPYAILIEYSRTPHFNASKLNVQEITLSTESISTTRNTLWYPNSPHPARTPL